ncbi:MAG: hypothetical protein JXQ71_13185 [Verrucomicrobia bacterium]|nr:hypothetical protein [Verrucomicrobiota bacterium]
MHHRAHAPVALPAELFGVCVASSEDPACDDYVVARLGELQVRCVRMDYGTGSDGTFAERFAVRLLEAGFRVGLHLVATKPEVEALARPEGAEGWRRFVRGVFARFAGAEFFEIGSTVNRRRWSGYTVPLFLRAWDIAWEESRGRGVTLAGPNVTDFEPFYNVPILHALRRSGRLPAIHTNNLFVERATEPEAFDPKILGRRCAPWIKYNTVKKARLLGAIGRWAGVPQTYSTQASWSLRRIRRMLENTEEQQADYVARYCALAAASGGLRRVYWGPLIGQREGLIDDGTDYFPDVFHVTFYGRANGRVRNYRLRPAFHAFRTVIRFLSGTTFTRQIPARGSLAILEFQSAAHTVHAVWCRNGDGAPAAACYDARTLDAAEVFDRDGTPLASPPALFTQRPAYLRWTRETPVRLQPSPATLPRVRLCADPQAAYAPVPQPGWHGLVLTRLAGTTLAPAALLPEQLAPMNSHAARVLRNKRNCVWSAPAPWDSAQTLVVKQFRPARGLRGWVQRFKPTKALRSWNGAHELLRRGIPTPRPLAWLEHPARPHDHESYYLCESFETATSARHAFYALNQGATEFLETPAADLLRHIATLLARMHRRGVFHRDLSAGNLLLRRTPQGDIEFALIDTGRARVRDASLPLRQRLADLMRLCHPLAWAGREPLLRAYLDAAQIRHAPWMRLAFHYYDWKHRVKRKVRRRR